MQIFDQLAGTKSHACMLEIRFRAGTKLDNSVAGILFFILYRQTIFF